MLNIFKKMLLLLLLSVSLEVASAQSTINSATIEQCYSWAETHYPLVAQLDLLAKSSQFNLENAAKGKLPQISIQGQATYQSEVTEIPLEQLGVDIPTLDKDQYKLYGEVYQSLTNFSRVNAQRQQLEVEGAIEQQSVAVDVYQLRDRINQIYFGILLTKAQQEQLTLIYTDLDSALVKLKAAVENGTATLMDQQLLQVEQIRINQQLSESQATQRAFAFMLAALTGQAISETTTLTLPQVLVHQPQVLRPELSLFAMQEQSVDARWRQIQSGKLPELGLFLQGGIGRPALNFLSNDLTPYYIGGLKLSWNLSRFYTSNNDRQLLDVQHQIISKQRETFLLNISLTQAQQSEEVRKFQEMIRLDEQAVVLQEQIKTAAEVQLVNGLITTIDYIKIINDVNRARQQLKLHELQMLQSQYNLKTTTGY